MRLFATSLLFALCLGEAQADLSDDIETTFRLDTVIVLTPFSQTDEAREVEGVLAETGLTGTIETVLDNGLRLRGRVAGRIQRDHPLRPGGQGGFGTTAPTSTGGFSGLSAGLIEPDTSLRSRFETAYFQIDGGYGELRVGKDQGVAARFHEGAPSLFTHARLDSALLDPTGLSVIRSRHDVTGQSAKFSYASPRLLGLRAGLSLTPEATADGLDRRPAAGVPSGTPDIGPVVEIALNGTRRFSASDIRLDIGLGWSQDEISNQFGLTPYQDMQTYSFGTLLEVADWRLGGSFLHSDNGYASGDYEAWSFGVERPWLDYDWALNYGEAEDDFNQIRAESWRIEFKKKLTNQARISLGLIEDKVRTGGLTERTQGIVVEITLSEEFMIFSGT